MFKMLFIFCYQANGFQFCSSFRAVENKKGPVTKMPKIIHILKFKLFWKC